MLHWKMFDTNMLSLTLPYFGLHLGKMFVQWILDRYNLSKIEINNKYIVYSLF